jgi:hypothetical protein
MMCMSRGDRMEAMARSLTVADVMLLPEPQNQVAVLLVQPDPKWQ